MIPPKQGNSVRIRLLKSDNINKPLESIVISNIIFRIGIEIIAKKNKISLAVFL